MSSLQCSPTEKTIFIQLSYKIIIKFTQPIDKPKELK